MENKKISKIRQHAKNGELLRPEEQTGEEFVVINFVESLRDVSSTNSTQEGEPHPIRDGRIIGPQTKSKLDKRLEGIQDENVRMIQLLIQGQITPAQLHNYLAGMDQQLNKIIPEIRKENAETYFVAKSAYREHYNIRHVGWIDKTRQKDKESLNIGIENIPLDAHSWTDAQKAELFTKKEVYAYIEDPKDFYKFHAYLSEKCMLYKKGEVPKFEFDDCPCTRNSIISKEKDKKTPLHVAVASNFSHFVQSLTELSQVNPHVKWLIFRWMFHRRNRKGVLISQTDGFNIFFDLLSSVEGDISPIWDLFMSQNGPFYQLVNSREFVDDLFNRGGSRIIYTPEYLQCSYIECGLTYLLVQGHIKQAYELFQNNYMSVSRAVFPGFLVELFRTEDQQYIRMFSNIILEWTKLERYLSVPLKDLLYPTILNGSRRCPDSFLHALIRKGSSVLLIVALELIKQIYDERNKMITMATGKEGWENAAADLQNQVNMENLNPLEFAIEQSQMDMVECLKRFGLQYEESYEYLAWYGELMNGIVNSNDRIFLGQLIDHYPDIPVLTFCVTIERDDLIEEIVALYQANGFTDANVDDLNQALVSALYPRRKNLSLISSSQNNALKKNRMMDIVAMLLIAGATLENFQWYKDINNLSKNVSLSVRQLISDVCKARKNRSFEREFRLLEDAYNEVFTYFGIPRVTMEEEEI